MGGQYFMFARCPGNDYLGYPCINKERGFGWAIQGFLDEKTSFPLSLTIDKWQSEPDIPSGEKYAIYRWDTVADAFDYSKSHSVHRFTASKETEVYTDPVTFASDGTTYYRCVVDAGEIVV